MILEDINVLVAGNSPYYHIQDAVTAAAGSPPKAVIIPATYSGTDTYTNASNVAIIDLRPSATTTGTATVRVTALTVSASAVIASTMVMNGLSSGIQAVAAAAAPITAATGGVFVTTLNAPGASVLEGTVFKVKATGWITFPAGTYTATVQPLLYASTAVGFTASAAAAIISVAAVNMTITSATLATTGIWESEADIWGDSTTGKVNGWFTGMQAQPVSGVQALVTKTALVAANLPTAVNFATVPPLQFQMGVTLANAGATAVSSLNHFYLEA